MKLITKLIIILSLSISILSQQTKILTNIDIINMVKAGLSESTIVLSIEKSKTNFNTTPDDLISLKKQGISSSIIEAMLKSGSATSNTTQNNNIPKNEDQITLLNEYGSGVLWMINDGQRSKMLSDSGKTLSLDDTLLGRMTGAGIFNKLKYKIFFNGEKSPTRNNKNVQFELGDFSSNARVEEYYKVIKVVKLNIKQNQREILTSSTKLSSTSQFQENSIIPINIEIAKTNGNFRLLRISVPSITEGEYVIIAGFSSYDFGIDKEIINSLIQNKDTKVINQQFNPLNGVPEVIINADNDKVRRLITQRYINAKYSLIKDENSQLVFSKEVGGVGGFFGGVFLGNNGKNPRQIVTFIINKTESGISLLAQIGVINPDRNGQGDIKNIDDKKTKEQIIKELAEIKTLAEK